MDKMIFESGIAKKLISKFLTKIIASKIVCEDLNIKLDTFSVTVDDEHGAEIQMQCDAHLVMPKAEFYQLIAKSINA